MLTDEQPARRLGALIAGTDIRYPMPGPGQHDLAGALAPDLTLHTSWLGAPLKATVPVINRTCRPGDTSRRAT